MYFNKWLNEQLEDLPITRADLSRLSGVSYSTMNGSKKFDPSAHREQDAKTISRVQRLSRSPGVEKRISKTEESSPPRFYDYLCYCIVWSRILLRS
mgnify:CR=1 FL=1